MLLLPWPPILKEFARLLSAIIRLATLSNEEKMKATPRKISKWMNAIEDGEIKLPSFQRQEVWKKDLTEKFLQAVINDHPLGFLLVLNVDSDNQPFPAASLAGIESGTQTEGCRQHLLDGQQRLTALYKVLKDKFSDRTYYVTYEGGDNETTTYKVNCVTSDARSKPWCNKPDQEYNEKRIPLRIFDPNADSRVAAKWVNEVRKANQWRKNGSRDKFLREFIEQLRKIFKKAEIHCFELKQQTKSSEVFKR